MKGKKWGGQGKSEGQSEMKIGVVRVWKDEEKQRMLGKSDGME